VLSSAWFVPRGRESGGGPAARDARNTVQLALQTGFKENRHPARRLAVSNCVIRDTGLNGIKLQMAHGTVMRDMVFSNIVMDNVTGPISVRCAGWQPDYRMPWAMIDDSRWAHGRLEGILFANIRARVPAAGMRGTPHHQPWHEQATARSCISITGTPQTRPRDIAFSSVDITFAGGGTHQEGERRDVPELERDYPEMYIFGVLPAYGLYARHVDGLRLSDVRLRLQSPDLGPAVVCDDVEGADISGLAADGDPDAEALLRLHSARRVVIAGSRPVGRVAVFAQVEGAASGPITLRGNQLDEARKRSVSASDVPPGAVRVVP
jgi:hypothetical protein